MSTMQTEVVVIGAGPGGYTAAFRAADLGKKVILVEAHDKLGGVCLNVGCIPSKALLHAAKIIDEAEHAKKLGITFNKPNVDLDKLRSWKEKIIMKLTAGLKGLAKQRKVEVVQGYGVFDSEKTLSVKDSDDKNIATINFEYAIIAAGSKPIKLPFLPDDSRIIDSTGALELQDIPEDMLVIGGGVIGMEMATVYNTLGTKVSVVELASQILPGVDKDLIAPLQKRLTKSLDKIMLDSKVTKVEAKKDGLWVSFEGKNAPDTPQKFAKILSAVGRSPNGKLINAEKAGINVDERGFITVDKQQRTNIKHIFAIGDIVGDPMLAHKAIPEGKVAAEVICGLDHYFDPKCIAAVAYTDPEIAWVGVTETQAKEQKLNYGTGTFPWAASGRAIAMDRDEGFTKVIFNKTSNQIIGAGIVGVHAGDLIAEVALAIEMGCDAEDIALTVHPHPTLAETICQATEAFEGTITDLYMPK